ncbi:MAG: hypothetical protein HKL83_06950 [Acidimicrobiaceae bacterium]|nr:hypothetical protein [Acidimicrobiaceae bacterium]
MPLFLFWLRIPQDRLFAAILGGLMGVTDFLDGYVARRIGQVSTVGKIIDPTCDRMVLVVSSIGLWYFSVVPRWLIVVVLAREVIVSVVVLTVGILGKVRLDVVWIGKLGTFILLTSFPLAVLASSSQVDSKWLLWMTEGAIVAGTGILFGAAFQYFKKLVEIVRGRSTI